MCECGCNMGNPTYRMPIDKVTCYVVSLYPGCRNCSAPPGIIIRKVEKNSIFWEESQEAPLLPLTKVDECTEVSIKCGPDPDEFRNKARPHVNGFPTRGRKQLDGDDADVMNDDIWDQVLCRMPEVIEYEQAKQGE